MRDVALVALRVGTGRTGEVEDQIDRVEVERQRHIVLDVAEPGVVTEVCNMGELARDEVIDADDIGSLVYQKIAQVGADEPRASGD